MFRKGTRPSTRHRIYNLDVIREEMGKKFEVSDHGGPDIGSGTIFESSKVRLGLGFFWLV